MMTRPVYARGRRTIHPVLLVQTALGWPLAQERPVEPAFTVDGDTHAVAA